MSKGYLAPPTINGVHLDTFPTTIEYTVHKGKSLFINAIGKAKGFFNTPGRVLYENPGFIFPTETHSVSSKLGYTEISREELEQIENKMNTNQIMLIVLWIDMFIEFYGDNVKNSYYLPYKTAENIPPQIPDPTTVQTTVTLNNTVIIPLYKTEIDYDAGTPGAGIIWFKSGFQEFKTGDTYTTTDRIVVKYIPILPLIEADNNNRIVMQAIFSTRVQRSFELREAIE